MQQPSLSNSLWCPRVARINDVVEVVAHGDKEVEEQLPAALAVDLTVTALLHLGLHGAAPLEGLAGMDAPLVYQLFCQGHRWVAMCGRDKC